MTSDWVEFEAIVATTHRVEKYGGLRIALDALQEMAETLNSKIVPMHGDHDLTKRIRMRNESAWIEALPGGEHALKLAGEVHREDWGRHGQPGMSFTMHQPIGRTDWAGPERGQIRLAGDAAFFSDESLAEAAASLGEIAPTEASRLYQFGILDEASRIVVEIPVAALQAVAWGLVTNGIWDALKILLSSRRKGGTNRSRIELVAPSPDGTVTGLIDTEDSVVAREAIAAFKIAVAHTREASPAARSVISWRNPEGEWTPPS